MNKAENMKELFGLIGSLFNETITEQDHARLQELLKSDAKARQLYFQYADVHLELGNVGERSEGLPELESLHQELSRIIEIGKSDNLAISESGQIAFPKHSMGATLGMWSGWMALSLAAVFALGYLYFSDRGEVAALPSPTATPVFTEYVATLLRSSNCKWGGEHRPQFDGQRLLTRELRLDEGLAELGFDSGVRILLEGPARLTIDANQQAQLHSGKLVLHGHDSADPFLVETPHSKLLDIGTEYGVSVDGESTEVHVFSGEVEIRSLSQSDAPQKILAEGEGAKFDLNGSIESSSLDTKYVRKIPEIEPQAASQLLASDSFDYESPTLRGANFGSGFAGPWRGSVPGKEPSQAPIDHSGSLSQTSINKDGSALRVLGGFSSVRTLKTPIDLGEDGVYYVSFFLEKEAGAPKDESQYMSISFRTAGFPSDTRKLHFGLSSENHLMLTHNDKQVLNAPPVATGETYFFVGKITAGHTAPDQLMMRVFGPQESIESGEPLVWSCSTPLKFDDTVFDQLLIYTARSGRFRFDEFRIGTSWESVTSQSE